MHWLPEWEWGIALLQNSYSFVQYIVLSTLVDEFLDSQGIPGESFDAREMERVIERERVEQLKRGREELFPGAPELAAVGPALPLPAYEGIYHHPAYQNITISMSESQHVETEPGVAGAPLPLFARGSEKSYLNVSLTLHHVSGEYWWALAKMGPSSFITDQLMKAKFEVGVSGNVTGVGLQVETTIKELAWFEKIA